jgi:GDP-4-dehydro-6-deoxy-D-mannose reductase
MHKEMSTSKIILATGSDGAIGAELQRIAPTDIKFIGTSTQGKGELHLDVTDMHEVQSRLAYHKPDVIFHLAAIVPIPQVEKDPDRAFNVNVLGLNNVLRVVHANHPKCKVVVLSSSEVYGNGMQGRKFIETDRFDPSNFYAFTKVAQEQLAMLYVKHGLNIQIARIFNYSSVYKKPIYSLESFASQIASLVREGKERSISVGNLQPQRDFLQGEDVATALFHMANADTKDIAFNVCRGDVTSMYELLQKIIRGFGTEIDIVIDQSKFRLIDNMYVCGDNTKLRSLGWAPQVSIDEMINRLVKHYKHKKSE